MKSSFMLTYSINWPAEVHQTARWLAKSTWEGIVEVQDVDLSHKFWGTLTWPIHFIIIWV